MGDIVNIHSFKDYMGIILIYSKAKKNGLAAVWEILCIYPCWRPLYCKSFEVEERQLSKW